MHDKERNLLISYLAFYQRCGVRAMYASNSEDVTTRLNVLLARLSLGKQAQDELSSCTTDHIHDSTQDRTSQFAETISQNQTEKGNSVNDVRLTKEKRLLQLFERSQSYEDCFLKKTARSFVFGEGNPDAQLLLIGEAPGAEEDRLGKPFVGDSGRLLTQMLNAIKISREETYILNVLPWRPPGNRAPTPYEIEQCRSIFQEQIAIVKPKLIVCLGGTAVKAVSGNHEGILKLRGRAFKAQIQNNTYLLFPTLHPSYLLRQPIQKKLAWFDFLTIRRLIDQL